MQRVNLFWVSALLLIIAVKTNAQVQKINPYYFDDSHWLSDTLQKNFYDSIGEFGKDMKREQWINFAEESFNNLSKLKISQFAQWVGQNHFLSFPYRILSRKDMSITESYLLKKKYDIQLHNIASGCVIRYNYEPYDSIMYGLITKKYGSNFFARIASQANRLDNIRMGLNVPTDSIAIKNLIQNTLTKIDSIEYYRLKYVLVQFHNGKINTQPCSMNWGKPNSIMTLHGKYILKWIKLAEAIEQLDHQPKFCNKKVKCNYYYDLKENKLFFESPFIYY